MTPDVQNPRLRPVERRVLAMRDEGLSLEAIALRLRRSEAHVRRVLAWIDVPRRVPPVRRVPSALERRVVTLRASGLGYEEIARRFARSPRFIRQVEGLAHLRHGRSEVVFEHGRSLLARAAEDARRAARERRIGGNRAEGNER